MEIVGEKESEHQPRGRDNLYANLLATPRRTAFSSFLPFFSIWVGGLLSVRVSENDNSWRDGGVVGDGNARKTPTKRLFWPKLPRSVQHHPYNIGRAHSSSFAIEASLTPYP